LGLPKLRIPTVKQLREGTWWLEEDPSVSKFSWLAEFEARLAQVQEVALWNSPVTSVVWLVVTQMLLLHLTSSPVLPTLAWAALAAFTYTTWAYRVWPAIRVPPEHPEDEEQWTPLHPDVLSAPEVDSWLAAGGHRVAKVAGGQALLRQEQPGRFCLLSSLLCCLLAVLGMQTSTAALLHTAALLFLTLPALLVRASKVPCVSPYLQLAGEVVGGLGEMCVYRGVDAPPLENKELDEFVPEVTNETESFLEKALSYVQRKENDEDTSLTSGLSIPSHEEVEAESSLLNDPVADLLPLATLAIDHRAASDSESECGEEEVPDLGESSGEEDSLGLEQSVGLMGLVTSSVASVTTTVSSVSSTVTSVSSLLGSFLTKADSEDPDLEDFELVSESDLELASP